MKSIQFKRTNKAGAKPAPEKLEVGEIALNLQDHTIFTKDKEHKVVQISVSPEAHAALDSKVTAHKKELDEIIAFNDQAINTKVDEIKTVTDATIAENDLAINEKVDTIKRETDAKINANKNTAASELATAKDELNATITANRAEALNAIATNDQAINTKVDGIKERTDATIKANDTAINEKVDSIKTVTDRTITANREHCDSELARLEARVDTLSGDSDGKFIKIHENVKTDGYLLSKTADYTHSEELQDGSYLDYFGAYRINGQDNWGANSGLLLNVPNASGKAHGRGFSFQYGSAGSKVYTYGFDAEGVKSFSYRVYNEGDKPTPAEIGAYSKTEVYSKEETDAKFKGSINSDSYVLSKTANYYDNDGDASARDLSKFGAFRTNNMDGFESLTLNVPHSLATKENLAHNRGFTFTYGSAGSTVKTYGYNASGQKAYSYRMYHEGDKPSPSELNVYSKQDSDAKYALKQIVTTNDSATESRFKSPNGTHQFVLANDGTINIWNSSTDKTHFAVEANGRDIKVIGDGDYTGLSLVKGDGRFLRLETNTHSATTWGNFIYREANGTNISVLSLPKENSTLATHAWSTGKFADKNLFQQVNTESKMRSPDTNYYIYVRNDGVSGMYKSSGTSVWAFNASGTMTNGLIPVSNGGTGAKDVTAARNNLQVYSKSEVDSKLGSAGGSFATIYIPRWGLENESNGKDWVYTAKKTINFVSNSHPSKAILRIYWDMRWQHSFAGGNRGQYITPTGCTLTMIRDDRSTPGTSGYVTQAGWTTYIVDIPANTAANVVIYCGVKYSTNNVSKRMYMTVYGYRSTDTSNYVTIS
ncbi:DUF1542 domain-containing protein [Providencia sp. JUb39]|uniref:DUF1542 domain-containing protein n=1 Tax=Providencia sp. JUb39 TaxID=2724165 RepID=UPI00164ECFE6|nr:DUF1542 domain-containing protein [Providencia sp. JUb39]MBC5790610.1 hypothetical protein [Providencia sp. JUb39]